MQQIKSFQPDTRLIVGIIFSVGVVASLALVLGALIAVAYLLNVAVSALGELASNITSVYGRSDSTMQFFMLFLMFYGVFHVVRFVTRPYITKRGEK
jgi:magnesium-transporting ATPase (P-type)